MMKKTAKVFVATMLVYTVGLVATYFAFGYYFPEATWLKWIALAAWIFGAGVTHAALREETVVREGMWAKVAFSIAFPLFCLVVFSVFSGLTIGAVRIYSFVMNELTKVETARRLDQEFREAYPFKVTASFREGSVLSPGKFTIENPTDRDWKSVYIIVNPDEGTVESISFAILEESGFRYPEKGKAINIVKAGASREFPLDEFIQIKTGEKFSTAKYQLRKAFIKAVVEYEGKNYDCTKWLAWNSKEP